MTSLLAATLILRGVIDQMDSGIAAIEWASEEISYLPVTALPPDIVEGDTVVFRVRKTHRRVNRVTTAAARKRVRHQHALERGNRRER